jgi:hypothetical protein
MNAETDGFWVIDDGTIGNGGGFFTDQVPGRPDDGSGINMSVGSELRSEEAEDEATPSVKGAR